MLDRETLFMVYGVGGVGKSELVYNVIEKARASERWRDAVPVLLQVQPHFQLDRVLATLAARVGAAGPDELAQIARVLDEVPHLVFVDDAHHLEPAAAAKMFGYLSRHVRASRIFAASRLEVPLAADAPPPVVTRVGALDEAATGEMVSLLARRLGIDVPDAGAVFERSKGSPFFIQREVASSGRAVSSGGDALEQAVRELSPGARRLLALATATRGRLGVGDLRSESGDARFDQALDELVRRFLIDVDRDIVIVHGLVGDALHRQADDDELLDARRAAVAVLLRRGDPLDIVEALHHRVAAGEHEAAWALIEERYRGVAAAGLDHLLLEGLRAVGDALPAARTPIDLLTARILVRRSLIDEAQEVVRRIGEDEQARTTYRYLFLAAEVAQRVGRLDDSAELFRRAREATDDPAERFSSGLALATGFAVRGHGVEARVVLHAIQPELEGPQARHRGRWAWACALSHALEEGHAQTYQVTEPAIAELEGAGADDLVTRLALLEAAARIETDEIAEARAILDRALEQASLRERVASLYQGIVLYGEGDLRGARVALDGAFEYFGRHRDTVYAGIAGRFLALVALHSGEFATAIDITARNAQLARKGGLDSILARAESDLSAILVATGDSTGAKQCAVQAMALPHSPVHARMRALCTLAHVCALEGDLEGTRAHLASAREIVAGDSVPARLREVDLVEAELSLLLGDLRTAIDRAEIVRAYYNSRSRPHDECRAGLALAAAFAARGSEADLVFAEKLVEGGKEIAARYGYGPLLLRAALVQAALFARRGDKVRAREHLTGAARTSLGPGDGMDAAAMRVALGTAEDVPAGVRVFVAALGLVGAERYVVADGRGRRPASDAIVERKRSECDLVVELERGLITGNRGAASIKGRPITCKLLAALIESQSRVVSAEELYTTVWGGTEYHPLRHRNTVYVALNRLRHTLSEMFPERTLIERVPNGWRLDGGLDACTIESVERA